MLRCAFDTSTKFSFFPHSLVLLSPQGELTSRCSINHALVPLRAARSQLDSTCTSDHFLSSLIKKYETMSNYLPNKLLVSGYQIQYVLNLNQSNMINRMSQASTIYHDPALALKPLNTAPCSILPTKQGKVCSKSHKAMQRLQGPFTQRSQDMLLISNTIAINTKD